MAQSFSGAERKKVNVMMEIKSASLPNVTSPKELKVTWARSNKQLPTKVKQIDAQNTVAVFKDKFMCDAGLRYDAANNIWLPDLNDLTLYCGSDIVGVCKFDISQLIDVNPIVHKVVLKPETVQEESTPTEMVFKGNAEEYGNAYIEFVVKVGSNRATTASRMSTRMASGAAAMDGNVQGHVDSAIEGVRVQYQPKIDALNDCLTKYKQQTEELLAKKESLEKRLNENMVLNPGDEAE